MENFMDTLSVVEGFVKVILYLHSFSALQRKSSVGA